MADLRMYYYIEESTNLPCLQPKDWDDREYIDDPDAVKPEVWDFWLLLNILRTEVILHSVL